MATDATKSGDNTPKVELKDDGTGTITTKDAEGKDVVVEILTKDKNNSVVQDRLARAKESWEKEQGELTPEKVQEIQDQLEASKAEVIASADTIAELRTAGVDAKVLEERANKSYELIMAGIPADKKKLIPTQLEGKPISKADQIQYVNDRQEIFFPAVESTAAAKPAPSTPAAEKKQPAGVEQFGGYSSLREWAWKDGPGYQKARAEGKIELDK